MKNIFARSASLFLLVAFAGVAVAGEVETGRRAGPGRMSAAPPCEVRQDTTVAKEKAPAPVPLLQKGHPVDWWFVFKLNAGKFPDCGEGAIRACLSGGTVQDYQGKFGQQFVYASSEAPGLQKGSGCVGNSVKDPLGATFDAVYRGAFYYVLWNDQFYLDPRIKGCGKSCGAPWGHSKGMLAWNDDGEGLVMQVTTPSWPGAGSAAIPRADGNTLGCVASDNNIMASQHFFALRLTRQDLVQVLRALQNTSVVTDPSNPQIVRNGGPAEIQGLVGELGKRSASTSILVARLSTGVKLISKPSALNVPPWQLVSATLDGTPLRAATWWMNPAIPTTSGSTPIGCWSDTLGKAGAVQIATTGRWGDVSFGLTGGPGADVNHAKIGVSTDTARPYSVFGDLNQQGALSGKCDSSQNGRGGVFYVVEDRKLFDGVAVLIAGESGEAVP